MLRQKFIAKTILPSVQKVRSVILKSFCYIPFFRTWLPSFPPSKKEYLDDQSEEFFCLHPNL